LENFTPSIKSKSGFLLRPLQFLSELNGPFQLFMRSSFRSQPLGNFGASIKTRRRFLLRPLTISVEANGLLQLFN
ncbi:hypothetical protein, partial [Listeria rocourtiae]|uniref:hypothetical protein n=1 Tax=Listeria rocourtiae TaxID=647910 RepID=UPI001AD8250B